MTGRVQAGWTNQILDEMQCNLGANRPDIRPEKLGDLRRLMNSAVRNCLVEDVLDAVEAAGLVETAAVLRAG